MILCYLEPRGQNFLEMGRKETKLHSLYSTYREIGFMLFFTYFDTSNHVKLTFNVLHISKFYSNKNNIF